MVFEFMPHSSTATAHQATERLYRDHHGWLHGWLRRLEMQTDLAEEHARAPSAQEVNEWLDSLEWVARLVEDLPDKPRRAFLMSRLDGMSQAEIAAELGVSVSMVKKYMAKALVHWHIHCVGAPGDTGGPSAGQADG